jgi:small subunit ribosomal protein S16
MSTRIRLQRHGKKGKPFFHIVVADQRAKRDGRFIEKLGTYNPNTNPATIDLDFERSVHWVSVGAEPTDTARAILSYRGVLMKEHLLRGVKKGALTEEQAEAKFQKWLEEKEGKIENKKDKLTKDAEKERNERLAAERKVSEERAAALAPQPEEEAPAEASEEAPATEEAAVEETPATEAPAEEAKEEAPAEEAKEEAPAEEAKEEAPAENEEEKKD